jgi:uncharacterized membrane protein
VIIAMLSIHFPLATGHQLNFAILLLLMGFGVALRHWRNLTFKTDRSERKFLILALALLISAFGVSRIDTSDGARPAVGQLPQSDSHILAIVHARCSSCHSERPTDTTFTSAPLGFRLDSLEQIRAGRDKIVQRAVRGKDMPLNNVTGMTDTERAELGAWLSVSRTH